MAAVALCDQVPAAAGCFAAPRSQTGPSLPGLRDFLIDKVENPFYDIILIGFYRPPTGLAAFTAELVAYSSGKGSVQFSLDQPIPSELIRRFLEFRV